MTGTVALIPGSRYLLSLAEGEFRVLGPVDADPAAIVFHRPVGDLEATSINGRLILNVVRHASLSVVLVFVNLTGGTADGVAELLTPGAAPPVNAST